MISEIQGKEGSDRKAASPLVGGLLRIHGIISRGLSISIRKCNEYLEKPDMLPKEAPGFSRYLTTLKWVTHSHHLSEDEIIYPHFKDRIEAPYVRLTNDHQDIARILVTLDQHIRDLSSGGVGKLREILGEFERLWAPHIRIEEENFTAEKLQMIMGMEEQLDFAKKVGGHGMKNSGPGPLALPFLVYNLEGRDRELFLMQIPWIVKKVLMPILWKGQWKSMSPFLL
jgi:hemerythrin-like domain-containing protein